MNQIITEEPWVEKLQQWANEYKISDIIGKSKEELLSLETLKIDFYESKKYDGFIAPEIEYLQNIKDLTLDRVHGLEDFSFDITKLKKLESLKIIATALKVIPEEIGQLTNLKEFVIAACAHFKSLPLSIVEIPTLETLILEHCLALEVLPISQKPLHNLKHLSIHQFQRLCIYDFIQQFPKLEEICFFFIPFRTFPIQLCDLKYLRELTLSSTGIKTLPPEIENLKNLEVLVCHSLIQIPEELCHLPRLKAFNYAKKKLETLPPSIDKLIARGFIQINNHEIIETIDTLKNKELLKQGFEVLDSYEEYIEEIKQVKVITHRYKQEPLVKFVSKEVFEEEYQQREKAIVKMVKKFVANNKEYIDDKLGNIDEADNI